MTRKKTVKRKNEIVFDPIKRKEFLTGFRKRKNERRSRAKAELERNLKNERKRIRQELKDGLKHLKKTYEPLRELTEADKADEYEDDDVMVKIVELSTGDLAAQRNMLGVNRGNESDEEEDYDDQGESEDETQNANYIPGMDCEMKPKKCKPTRATEATNKNAAADETSTKIKKPLIDANTLRSKKDMDKLMKTKTLNKLKKSKVFKMKERFDKKANQKKVKRERNNTLKSLPKHLQKKKKFETTSKYRKGRLVNKKQMRRKRSADD